MDLLACFVSPIYATKLTNGIIEHKLKEHNMLTKVKR